METASSIKSGRWGTHATSQETQPQQEKKSEHVFKIQRPDKSESPIETRRNSSKMSVDDGDKDLGKRSMPAAAAVRHSTAMSLDEEAVFKEPQSSGGPAKSSREANLMSVDEVFDKSAESQPEDKTKIGQPSFAGSDSTKVKGPIVNLSSAQNPGLIDLTSDSEDEQQGKTNLGMISEASQRKHTDHFQRNKPRIVISDDEDLFLNDSLPDLDNCSKDVDLQRKLHTQSFRQMRDSSRRHDEDEEDIDSGKELFDSSEDDEYEYALPEPQQQDNNPPPNKSLSQNLDSTTSQNSDLAATAQDKGSTSGTGKSHGASKESQIVKGETPPPKTTESAETSASSTKPGVLPVLSHPMTTTSSNTSSVTSDPKPSAESQTARMLPGSSEQIRPPPPGLTQQLTQMKISGTKGKSGAAPSLQVLIQERKKAMDELAREKVGLICDS